MNAELKEPAFAEVFSDSRLSASVYGKKGPVHFARAFLVIAVERG